MISTRRKCAKVAIVAIASTALLTPTYAVAGNGNGNGDSRGRVDGGSSGGKKINATATRVVIKKSKTSVDGNAIAPSSPNWNPPACWYEPAASPRQLKQAFDRMNETSDVIPVTATLRWGYDLMKENYADNINFNLDKQDSGSWWRSVRNPNRMDDPAGWDCDKFMFWADEGATPDVPNAISPRVLAEYAYDSIEVPDTEVEMNPAGKSTVNVPTWMWLDKAKFEPIEVTASLPGTSLWATTTAEPVSLRLEPGTKDATTHPASGNCPITNGKIGTPYTKGNAKKTPPCGITYQRATTNTNPHKLKATLTWKITWQGTNNTGGNLPNGTFDTTQNITVQEAQSINR